MADRIALVLQPRTTLGKKVKALRRAGTVPVHLYGPAIASRPLQCQSQELIKVVAQAGGHTPISVTVEGEKEEHLAFVREIQWDPIRGNLFHVDLLRAEATQRLSADVPVVMTGKSPGAREVGTVVQLLYSVTVEALPLDMPPELSVDLSSMVQPDAVVRVGDMAVPSNVSLLTDPEAVVARIELPKEIEEEAEVVEGKAAEEASPEAEEPQAE